MAYRIDPEICEACGSCEDVCPNKAISHKGKVYTINPNKCQECVGDFDEPQCVDVCQSGAIEHV
ncbi:MULTISPECIES: 4Fe-4S binding protein [Breoghania]|uniref:4Fe-4S binding protein n=1 Tax=Breoghania corrubedonensis TaxID=665038 RepID=A0A2T5VGI7_9HYPH|nr:4Fe-4S binding protein [Breoghania corrubedonensis]PTW62855.1 4Fe-4S binding protein [Breoghania corrubedonensis]